VIFIYNENGGTFLEKVNFPNFLELLSVYFPVVLDSKSKVLTAPTFTRGKVIFAYVLLQ